MFAALYLRLNNAFRIIADLNVRLEADVASNGLANEELLGAGETSLRPGELKWCNS